jgi:hypothetical protein
MLGSGSKRVCVGGLDPLSLGLCDFKIDKKNDKKKGQSRLEQIG